MSEEEEEVVEEESKECTSSETSEEEKPRRSKRLAEKKNKRKRRNKKRQNKKPAKKAKPEEQNVEIQENSEEKNLEENLEDQIDVEIGQDEEKNLNTTVIFVINSPNELAGSKNATKTKETKTKEKEKENEEEDLKDMYGPFLPKDQDKEIVVITFHKTFDTLQELIELGEKFDPGVEYDCYIDMRKLHRIVDPLKELDEMIGLKKFKKSIIDQLIYILTTDFSNPNERPMMHSLIQGSSGLGKSTASKILGKIYAGCGLLSKGELILAKREDFVGEFLGSTTLKTKKLLERCKGNVLFIDEVYSLGSGNSSHKDSFAKEAVDCLNVFSSENYHDFICIIAGYKEDIERCFFSTNAGLRRRFTYVYTMDNYSPQELCEMFHKFVKDEGYKLAHFEKLGKLFVNEKDKFPYFGGDVKTLLDKCKIVHSRKKILLDRDEWHTLSPQDIQEGFTLYLQERELQKENPSYLQMYI